MDGVDEVAGAVEVGAPDGVLVVSAEQGGEMHYRVDPSHCLRQRVGVTEVTSCRGRAGRQVEVASDERAAVDPGRGQPWQHVLPLVIGGRVGPGQRPASAGAVAQLASSGRTWAVGESGSAV